MQILKYLFIIAAVVLIGVFSAWYSSVNEEVSEFFGIVHEVVFSDESVDDILFRSKSALPQLMQKSGNRSSVVIDKKDKYDDGYVLYTGHTTQAYLIDRKGKEVYKWSKPFTEVWPDAEHVFKPHIQDENIYWMDAVPTRNGDLYVNYERPFAFPSGFGFAKLSKTSKVLWKYSANTHHWFDVVENIHRVYVLENEVANAEEGENLAFKKIILDDYVVILDSRDGSIIDRFSIQKAFKKSDYKGFLDMHPNKKDILHSNKITYIDKDLAKKLPNANEGDVFVSLRNVNAVAVIDGRKKVVKWALTGPWFRQHDPDILDNGNMLIFDNRSQAGPRGSSRIVEYDFNKHKIAWSYRGTKKHPFKSTIRGLQQKMKNGNVLITSSEEGRVFEVTKDMEIVWEFYNAHQHKGKQSNIGTGKYFNKNYFKFMNNK